MNIGKTLIMTGVIAAASSLGSFAIAQQPGARQPAPKTDLQIGHVTESKAVDRLFEAVQQLREATVMLSRKEVGPERAKALKATQDAMILAQLALAELPPEMYSSEVKLRAAKDWPLIMSQLDEATQELESAIKAVRSATDQKRVAAVETVQKALDKARQAMAALPAWSPPSTSAAKGGSAGQQ